MYGTRRIPFWNSAEVKSSAWSSNGLKSSPCKSDAQIARVSFSFVSHLFSFLSFSLSFRRFLSPSLEILLYPSFRGSSDVTNEPECAFERVLRIGHGELRTEIPSYGVTDREWSRTPRGEFLLGRRGTVRDKTDVLIEVPPLAFPIAELRSAFDRIVLNAYLRAALPRAMHEEPRVIAGIVDE